MLKNESISSCSIQYLISRKRSEVSKSAQLSNVSTSSHPSLILSSWALMQTKEMLAIQPSLSSLILKVQQHVMVLGLDFSADLHHLNLNLKRKMKSRWIRAQNTRHLKQKVPTFILFLIILKTKTDQIWW